MRSLHPASKHLSVHCNFQTNRQCGGTSCNFGSSTSMTKFCSEEWRWTSVFKILSGCCSKCFESGCVVWDVELQTGTLKTVDGFVHSLLGSAGSDRSLHRSRCSLFAEFKWSVRVVSLVGFYFCQAWAIFLLDAWVWPYCHCSTKLFCLSHPLTSSN